MLFSEKPACSGFLGCQVHCVNILLNRPVCLKGNRQYQWTRSAELSPVRRMHRAAAVSCASGLVQRWRDPTTQDSCLRAFQCSHLYVPVGLSGTTHTHAYTHTHTHTTHSQLDVLIDMHVRTHTHTKHTHTLQPGSSIDLRAPCSVRARKSRGRQQADLSLPVTEGALQKIARLKTADAAWSRREVYCL